MPGIDFHKLRREITMEQVLDLLGFQCIRRRGDQWYGYCPLHESETKHRPAFSVNVARNCYYCHKCRRGGDQFKLWAEATKLPLYPATIDLCHQLGLEVPWLHRW
jgi:DNA primase